MVTKATLTPFKQHAYEQEFTVAEQHINTSVNSFCQVCFTLTAEINSGNNVPVSPCNVTLQYETLLESTLYFLELTLEITGAA